MTTSDAAELLGTCSRNVGRLIKEGKIPATMKGKTWIVTAKPSDLRMSYTKGRHRNKRRPAPSYEGLTILGEVCQTLGMDRRRVVEMLLTGELVGSKITGKWYVDNESLRKYLKETAPDQALQRIFHDLALGEQEEREQQWAGQTLPYTEEEHLAWWGINSVAPEDLVGDLRLRPTDRKALMQEVGPICRQWRPRDLG